MKRNRFLLSMAAIMAAPVATFSQIRNRFKRSDKGFKVPAGEGRIHGHIQLKGVNKNIIDVKVSGSDTDGDMAIFEQTSLSQGRGTPLHVHNNQDEVFVVKEGQYIFEVGGERHQLSVGDSIFLPRMVPHAWTQVSLTGKMMVILQPAGKLENFFVTMAALRHEPSKSEIAKIFEENDMKVVGPPIEVD